MGSQFIQFSYCPGFFLYSVIVLYTAYSSLLKIGRMHHSSVCRVYWRLIQSGLSHVFVVYFEPMTVTFFSIYIINQSELGTLEWITFNPDCLIRISTVETFNFSP